MTVVVVGRASRVLFIQAKLGSRIDNLGLFLTDISPVDVDNFHGFLGELGTDVGRVSYIVTVVENRAVSSGIAKVTISPTGVLIRSVFPGPPVRILPRLGVSVGPSCFRRFFVTTRSRPTDT